MRGLFNRDKRGIECPPPYLSSTRGRTWKSYENAKVMVSLNKQKTPSPVCERLALGRTSSCKILPQLLLMALRIDQTNCVNGTGTLRSESVAHGRTDVRCEHRQIVTQLSHRKVDIVFC